MLPLVLGYKAFRAGSAFGPCPHYQSLVGFGGGFTDASGELRPMELELLLGAANRFRLSLALVARSLVL